MSETNSSTTTNLASVILEELVKVNKDIAEVEAKLRELQEQRVGLLRLAERRGVSVPSQEPLTLASAIIEVLSSSQSVPIAQLREGIQRLGIHPTDGTLNTTLHELRARGLIIRAKSVRGIWMLVKPHCLVADLLKEENATSDNPAGETALITALEAKFPSVFGGRKPRYNAKASILTACEEGLIANFGSYYFIPTSDVPKF